MKDEITDKQTDVLSKRLEEAYQRYLSDRKNKRNTAIREDAFKNGVMAGLEMSLHVTEILIEMGVHDESKD
jgi:hypothetical protein